MADVYTVLWTSEHCRKLAHAGDAGPLRVVFGGPHGSQPSLTRYGVKAGDFVCPVRVEAGRLYVIAAMEVEAIVSFEQYVREELQLDGTEAVRASMAFGQELARERPDLAHRAPVTCADQAALGRNGWTIDMKRIVPVEIVRRLQFISRRGTRAIKHLDARGHITHVASLQGGVYRLTPESARDILSFNSTRETQHG